MRCERHRQRQREMADVQSKPATLITHITYDNVVEEVAARDELQHEEQMRLRRISRKHGARCAFNTAFWNVE